MAIKKKLFFISLISIIFFLVQYVSALTANSSDYSVSMFGTGLAAANPSSANYNSTALSEAKGTTRNAESGTYTGNIGFFENTTYYRTVSITSYSISPSSAVVGSSISLYISALNYQSVWAKITSPNSQEQTTSLVNNQFVVYNPPSLVGRYSVTFYANSSTGAIASAISYFDLTEQTTTPSGGGSSGGGTTTIIEKCTYNWDCTPWGVCSEGKIKRICINVGDCTGTESKPKEEIECPQALFDVSLKLKDIKLSEDRILNFSINFMEKMTMEKIDVHIKSSIINKDGYEIFSQIETRAVQGNLSYEKEIDEIKLVDGEYTLRVDILYGNLQRAFAEQRFEITKGKIELKEELSFQKTLEFLKVNLAYIVVILLVLSGVILTRSYASFIYKRDGAIVKFSETIKSKGKYLAYLLFGLLAIGFLITIYKLDITGRIVGNLLSNRGTFLPLIIIIVLALLIIFRKRFVLVLEKIIELLSGISDKNKKYPSNSILGLMNKKVYSENGHYIGKVNDIIIENNKIESLKINIDKKYKFKARGISMSYRHVKNVSEVVIIEEKIYENLINFQ